MSKGLEKENGNSWERKLCM